MFSDSQRTNTTGVKADPKFLRDPSALESISSALYGLSSYVAYSLPTSLRKVASNSTSEHNTFQRSINHHHEIDPQNHPLHSDGLFEKKKDVIVYAAFDEIVSASSSKLNASVSQSVLMLGYPDGFQIWNVSSVDNIHELVSIRDEDKLREVTYIKSIPNPRYISKHARDKFADVRPLIGLVCISTPTSEGGLQEHFSKQKSVLNFFSLKTHQIIKTLDFDNEGNIVGIKCNERAIVISMSNPAKLNILSPLTLAPLFQSPLQDVALHPSTRTPIFTLGHRLLAYATTSQPSESDGKKDDLGDGSDLVGSSSGKYQVVAKGVAKEVVNGVKFLNQTLSAYFANASNSQAINQIKQSSSMPINIQNHSGGISSSRGSFSPSPSPSNGHYYNSRTGSVGSSNSDGGNGFIAAVNNGIEIEKDNGAIGAIIIRDLGVPSSFNKKEPSIIAHFAPHTYHVGQLSFNPSGTLLFSTSVQGHKFHVFEILGKRRNHKNMKHMYQLSRGYTYASVGESGVGWSSDSRWCAVASGKGTIHLFAINPYGGPTHVPSHISGLVKNVDEPYSSTTQSPVVRIKSRAPLPADSTELASNGSSQNNVFPHEYYSFPPPNNASFAATSSSRRPSPSHYSNTNIYPTHHLNGHHSSFPYSIPIDPFYVRKPPGICIRFLPSLFNNSKTGLTSNNNGLLFANLNARRQAKRRSSPSINYDGNANSTNKNGRRRTRSWSQNSLLGVNNSGRRYFEVENLESKQEDIGYQDLLSFHPSGILTLHRVWMEGVVVGEQDGSSRQGSNQESNLITMAGTPLAGSAAAVANVGRALVGGATTVVGGITGVTRKEAGSLDMITDYDDVAEWQLIRGNNWAEVKNVFEAPKQSTESGDILFKRDGNNKWLANSEIATHTSSRTSLPPPLWASPQFTFQTFLPGYTETIRKGEIPRSKKIEIRRDVVEHVEMIDDVDSNMDSLGVNGWVNNGENNYVSRNQGRTSKTILIQAGKAIGKGDDDISINLSNAMDTSLDFSPSSPTLSAISTKSKDRMSNGFNGHTCTISGDMSIIPLSFEDAYHIQISNNNPTTVTNTTAINSTPSKLNNANISSNTIANSTINPHPLSIARSTTSSINTSETIFSEEVDASTKEVEHTENFINEEGNFFFSPDGDNEVDFPSNSVIELQRGGKGVCDGNGIEKQYMNGKV